MRKSKPLLPVVDTTDYDVLIIGGGLVGASLACAMRWANYRVGVVEAVPFSLPEQPSYDHRGLVLSLASKRIMAGLELWNELKSKANPVRRIHVSDQGSFGFTRLEAGDFEVDAFGYVITGIELGRVLVQQLEQVKNVEYLTPALLKDVTPHEDHILVDLEVNGQARTVRTRLLVAADGGRSKTRALLRIAVKEHDYRQTALVCVVTPSGPHNDTAYERFTKSGPMALLPMQGRRCVAIYTVPSDRAAQIQALDDDAYLQLLQQRLGHRLPRFAQAGKRHAYPLQLTQALQLVMHRSVVIGNAAHTIHPNGAQGLNLGLRDVAMLAEVLVDAGKNGIDPGDRRLLNAYAGSRAGDQRQVIRFTHGLTRLFYNDFVPIIIARNLAMLAVDTLPALKRALVHRAMGISGRQPRLVCGLPLAS